MVASLEPTPLFPAARSLFLFRRFGILLLDDLRESPPDIFARLQTMSQPLHEALVFRFRRPALLRGLHWGDVAALVGRSVFVPLKGVAAGEEVATEIAEMYFEWVRLRGLGVSFKLLEVLELRIRTEAAFDFPNRPTRDVGLRSLEEQPKPILEFAGYLEKPYRSLMLLPYRAVDTVRPFVTNTPLNPGWLPIRGFYRAALLETRSQRGLVVKSVRNRGREPLRSASRLLGFINNLRILGSWPQGCGGPGHGPLCFLDPRSLAPDSFLGRHIVGIDPHQAPIAFWLLCLKAMFPKGRCGCVNRCRI